MSKIIKQVNEAMAAVEKGGGHGFSAVAVEGHYNFSCMGEFTDVVPLLNFVMERHPENAIPAILSAALNWLAHSKEEQAKFMQAMGIANTVSEGGIPEDNPINFVTKGVN